MATQAQMDANRSNAQHSTGPRTEEGKAKSSRNATRFGLFATNTCVMPGEEDAYVEVYHTLWDELAPVGALEQVTAGEYVRATWLLRRCAMAEEQLEKRAIADQARRDKFSLSGEYTPPSDPILACQRDTLAILRASTQAQNAQKRALAELYKLQAARRARAAHIEAEPEAERQAVEPEPDLQKNPIAGPTQSEPLPQPETRLDFPCPCGSALQIEECCGTIGSFQPPLRPAA